MFNNPGEQSGLGGHGPGQANAIQPPSRNQSMTEMALDRQQRANDALRKTCALLEDRLNPLLGEAPKVPAGAEARPRMSAQLPEAIMAQAEITEEAVRHLSGLLDRIAL